ncbi:MAG TPA: helix-turn-helix domain-containing protein [Nocardioides sp.]|nr:helix-turn-helix domain-containing protein [Nocardioides sp.]
MRDHVIRHPHEPPDIDDVELPQVMHALSDPGRLEVIRKVGALSKDEELPCTEIDIPVSKATGSHHLRVLREAGLITERREGRNKYIQLRRAELDRRFPGLLTAILHGE